MNAIHSSLIISDSSCIPVVKFKTYSSDVIYCVSFLLSSHSVLCCVVTQTLLENLFKFGQTAQNEVQ